MKKIFVFSLVLFSIFLFSQDFKKSIAQEACKCVKENVKDDMSEKQVQLKFGICMMKVTAPYKKEIKKEFGIDLDDYSKKESMYELGRQMGLIMAQECPEVFERFIKDEDLETTEENSGEQLMHGEIAKIEKDSFVVFYLKGDNNILTKFYWISNVDSNIELEKKYNELTGKKVDVVYYSAEIFDYKINEYRKVNILQTLKTE